MINMIDMIDMINLPCPERFLAKKRLEMTS